MRLRGGRSVVRAGVARGGVAGAVVHDQVDVQARLEGDARVLARSCLHGGLLIQADQDGAGRRVQVEAADLPGADPEPGVISAAQPAPREEQWRCAASARGPRAGRRGECAPGESPGGVTPLVSGRGRGGESARLRRTRSVLSGAPRRARTIPPPPPRRAMRRDQKVARSQYPFTIATGHVTFG
jgi:hypothetical protein